MNTTTLASTVSDETDSSSTSLLKKSAVSRRSFLVSTSASVSALTLGFHVPSFAKEEAKASGPVEVNAWVVIHPDDRCVIRIARAEMGQGSSTGLAQLVAEELECDWKKVSLEFITPGQNLARDRVWKNMSTGGSRGIRESQEYVRQAGAAARMMLIQAAATQWGVPASDVSAKDGILHHESSKRSLHYGQVSAQAALLSPPGVKTIRLKNPKDWTIAGKPAKRLDTAHKVDGSLKYAIDHRAKDMLYAAIKASPVFEGKLKSFDATAILKKRGI